MTQQSEPDGNGIDGDEEQVPRCFQVSRYRV
jgi:hypothetical protein